MRTLLTLSNKMGSEYKLQRKAIDAIKNNRMKFANKMDTFLIVNTNIISRRLHSAIKQRIEATLTQQGGFFANCMILDQLVKFDTGGMDLLEAFREIEYKGPHHDLALILSTAINNISRPSGCSNTALSAMVHACSPTQFHSTLPSDIKSMKLSTAVQENTQSYQISQQEKRTEKTEENQLTELTSLQHEAVNPYSTSCNVTSQRQLTLVKELHTDVNKSQPVQRKEDMNKEIRHFLDNELSSVCLQEETMQPEPIEDESDSASEPMSDSFVLSESQIRQAFGQEGNNVVHEIEELKLFEDDITAQTEETCIDSQTFVKQVHNGGSSAQADCDEGEVDNQSEIYDSQNFIEVNPKREKSKVDSVSSLTFPKQIEHEEEIEHADNVAGFPESNIDSDKFMDEHPIKTVNTENKNQQSCDINFNENNEVDQENIKDGSQNPAHDNSNTFSSVNRLNSCPVRSSHDEYETNIASERHALLSRAQSAPAERSNFAIFNALIKNRRLSACKGIAGNL